MRTLPVLLLPALLLASCGSETSEPVDVSNVDLGALHENIAATASRGEHDAARVKVEHILLSFAGTGTEATRSKAEAQALTAQVLARVEAGEDFSALREEHSDDTGPGVYTMSGDGSGDGRLVIPRQGMVPAFGNTGWRLEVGQVGVAAFHQRNSPYGWHIVKRLE